MTEPLRRILAQNLERTGRKGSDFIFGCTQRRPFDGSTVTRRARDAWAAARRREDEETDRPPAQRLRPIGLQECRHSAVSQMLDAGIPIEKVTSATPRSQSRSTATGTCFPVAKPKRSPSSTPTTTAANTHHPLVQRDFCLPACLGSAAPKNLPP
jgi:hypothetical protein